MANSEEGYAKGGKVEITPEAKKIPKELEKASKMHKGQAERLKGMGFGHGGEMKYAKGGAIHTPVKAEPSIAGSVPVIFAAGIFVRLEALSAGRFPDSFEEVSQTI